MASKQHGRTSARCRALEILYTSEIQGKKPTSLLEEGGCLLEDNVLSDYAVGLVKGAEEHGAEFDEKLAETSENWAVERMPIVDRCIFHIALYEMLYVDEVPVSVSINEAVELAKMYGGEDESAGFVNGVLGRIARGGEDGAKAQSEPEAAPVETDGEEA